MPAALFGIFSFTMRLPNPIFIKKQLPSLSKTTFSYFDELGRFCCPPLFSSRQVLNQIFPALAAHGIARNYGTFPPARPGSRMYACARAPLGCGVAYVPISPCMCISRSILNLYVYILHLLMFYLYLHRYTCMCTQIIKLYIYIIYIIYILYIYILISKI